MKKTFTESGFLLLLLIAACDPSMHFGSPDERALQSDWNTNEAEPPEHPLAEPETLQAIRQFAQHSPQLTPEEQKKLEILTQKLREQVLPRINRYNLHEATQTGLSVGRNDALLENLARFIRLKYRDFQDLKPANPVEIAQHLRQIADDPAKIQAILNVLHHPNRAEWILLRNTLELAASSSTERDAFLCAQREASSENWVTSNLPNSIREWGLQMKCSGSNELISRLNQFSQTKLKPKLDAFKPLGLSKDIDDREATWAGIALIPLIDHMPESLISWVYSWNADSLKAMLLSLAELIELVPESKPGQAAAIQALFEKLYQHYSGAPVDQITQEHLKSMIRWLETNQELILEFGGKQ